jgi:hypothetical protein
LTRVGGVLVRSTRTAPDYRLYALDGSPARPGLVRSPGDGAPIDVAAYRLGGRTRRVPVRAGTAFIGTVELGDGQRTSGFLCEACATARAKDITEHGGWRAYLDTGQSSGRRTAGPRSETEALEDQPVGELYLAISRMTLVTGELPRRPDPGVGERRPAPRPRYSSRTARAMSPTCFFHPVAA